MATDLTVILEDRPGELARLGEAAGEGGINLQGMAAFTGVTGEGKGVIHVLVEDAAKTRATLEAADIRIADEREALVFDLNDQPGSLGELARRLSEVGVNIELAYTTFGGVKVVIVTDDVDAARSVL
jgi:hypothetical protein